MTNKPTMPNIPGIGAMTDTLDFVKNLWGGMSVPGMTMPGMVMPTLSVDEINKQVSDLKAVEAWLTLNMNMLRATIQSLEVQSATISTLKSMGESFSAAVKSGAAKPAADAAPKDSYPPFSKPAAKAEAEAAPQPPAPDASNESQAAPKSAPKGPSATEPAGSSVAAGNPALWWNMLQDQFKQAVTTAMASEKKATTPAVPAKPETKRAAAPRKRKPSPKKS
jgi:hypothetical protein